MSEEPIISSEPPESIKNDPTSFTVIRQLGKGQYGVVNLVRGDNGQEYAQKKISLTDAAAFNEIDLSLRLIHPHLIRAFHA